MASARVGNTAKKLNGVPFKKGVDPRRNVTKPGPGRPKDEASITYWMKQFAGMTPVQVADYCEVFAKELRKHPGELPIAGVIAVRALMQAMDEPQPGMFGHVLDRTEGPVKQHVEVSGDEDKPLHIFRHEAVVASVAARSAGDHSASGAD